MIFDFHNDILTENISGDEINNYFNRFPTSKIVCAFFTTKMSKPLEFIKNGIETFKRRKNLLFSIEDIHFLNDFNVEQICLLPILYCTLAWKENNAIAGGHAADSGITPLGKRIIRKLNSAGIITDTAHLNQKSFYDAAEISDLLINSHTCLNEICDHSRNLTHEQIEIIIQKGGLVALTAVRQFMREENATVLDYANQFDSFIQRYGIDNVAVGTDFFGTEHLNGLKDYNDFDNLGYLLENKGYSYKDINQIFYGNAERFILTHRR